MHCPECGQRLLIAASGLVCEGGCGRIHLAVETTRYTLAELRSAFPELVIGPTYSVVAMKRPLPAIPAVEPLAGQLEMAFDECLK